MSRFQGKFKHVLCVCTANMLRSPTAALVLSQDPFNYNTRSAGVWDGALIKITPQLLTWADEIVTMEPEHTAAVRSMMNGMVPTMPIIELGIPDDYEYRDPALMKMITLRYSMLKAMP